MSCGCGRWRHAWGRTRRRVVRQCPLSYRVSRWYRGCMSTSALRIVYSQVFLLSRRVERWRNGDVSNRAYPNADRVTVREGRGSVRRGGGHADYRQRMDSPFHLIHRFVPRQRVGVRARGRLNDRGSERCFRPFPMVASSGVARCVRVGRRHRRNWGDRGSRRLRDLYVRLPIVLLFALAGRG